MIEVFLETLFGKEKKDKLSFLCLMFGLLYFVGGYEKEAAGSDYGY